MSQYKLNKKKYRNAVLYFIKHCNNSYLGATKFNKLFYYLDFVSYRDRGISVTGDKYLHFEYGPVPAFLKEGIMPQMKSEGLINVDFIRLDDGNKKYTFEAKREPDLKVYDDYEKKLLEKICKEFINYNTRKIVSQTHIEAPWYYSDYLDEIDFEDAKDIDILTNVQQEKCPTL